MASSRDRRRETAHAQTQEEKRIRTEAEELVMASSDVPPEEQVEALWMWAEGAADGEGKRWLSRKEIIYKQSCSQTDRRG